jgi:enamine deaminase RidA (YjgF/YER057c/UK114 family)
MEALNPQSLGRPRGYSNGMLADPGRILFVAGQIGWDSSQRLVSNVFAAQFEQALANVLAVVRAAGGAPEDIGRFTIYVVDRHEYAREAKPVGQAYRKLMGGHYPAMALVQVASLLEEGAKVEIEATAVIPSDAKEVG